MWSYRAKKLGPVRFLNEEIVQKEMKNRWPTEFSLFDL